MNTDPPLCGARRPGGYLHLVTVSPLSPCPLSPSRPQPACSRARTTSPRRNKTFPPTRKTSTERNPAVPRRNGTSTERNFRAPRRIMFFPERNSGAPRRKTIYTERNENPTKSNKTFPPTKIPVRPAPATRAAPAPDAFPPRFNRAKPVRPRRGRSYRAPHRRAPTAANRLRGTRRGRGFTPRSASGRRRSRGGRSRTAGRFLRGRRGARRRP